MMHHDDASRYSQATTSVKPPPLPSMVPHTSLTIRLQQKLDIHPEYIPDNTTMVSIRSTGAGSSPTVRRIQSTGAGSSPTDRILWGRFGVIVKPPLLPSMVPHTSLTIGLQQKLDIPPENEKHKAILIIASHMCNYMM